MLSVSLLRSLYEDARFHEKVCALGLMEVTVFLQGVTQIRTVST